MAVEIYTLGCDCNRDVVIRTSIDYFDKNFIAKKMLDGWISPAIRIHGKSKRLRDFISWMMPAPVISEKARQVLEPLIIEYCEILPLIELRGIQYYAINVLTLVDCLDHKGSNIIYANDDPLHILRISRYLFKENTSLLSIPIFKIPEDSACVFVTNKFVNAVIENELRGASFIDPSVDPFIKLGRGESLNVISNLPQ